MSDRAKIKIRPRRNEDGELRYDASLVINGRPIVTTHNQGYNRRHRARETILDALSGRYANVAIDDPGADALEDG